MKEPSVLPGLGERIRKARERISLSHDELARRLGTSRANIYDLESHDDELVIAYSLQEALLLAQVLRISLLELLAPGTAPVQRVSLAELAEAAKDAFGDRGMLQPEAEEAVGWVMGDFLLDPSVAMLRPISFLSDLCREVRLGLLDVICGVLDTESSAG